MTSYTTDKDFDFYSQLNDETEETIDEEKKCMISHLPLTYNSILLPCNHSFNYMPLYNELCENNIRDGKLICPYCRAVSWKLIPYIQLPCVKKLKGINFPPKFCMSSPTCAFILKNGNPCNANAVESEKGIFCNKHMTITPTNDLTKKSVVELRTMLRAKGLKVGGLKKELIKRLVGSEQQVL